MVISSGLAWFRGRGGVRCFALLCLRCQAHYHGKVMMLRLVKRIEIRVKQNASLCRVIVLSTSFVLISRCSQSSCCEQAKLFQAIRRKANLIGVCMVCAKE